MAQYEHLPIYKKASDAKTGHLLNRGHTFG
jgi:hypothetical protein